MTARVQALSRSGQPAQHGASLLLGSALAIIIAFDGGIASAQSITLPPESSAPQSDIVVTAQKRSETAQRVPIAITAISGEQMATQNIRSALDVTAGISNLKTQSPLGDGIPIFAVRGISMSDFSFSQDGPIATYYDEVYHGNLILMGLAVYDLERVEVLKGPQSTLYGKNTTGGAINFISHRPNFDTEGYVSAGFGNYNHIQADAAFQTKLTDTVASRTAFTFDHADGWYKNLSPGKPDLASTRQYAVRQSFLVKPTSGLSILLRGSTSLQNPLNYGIPSLPVGGGVGALYTAVGIPADQRAGLSAREGVQPDAYRRHARTYSLSTTIEANLTPSLSLTSITAWDKGDLLVHEDSDGSALRVADVIYAGRANQVSQELRLVGSWGNGLSVTAGAYANRERIENGTTLRFFADLDLDGNGKVDAADCVASGFVACLIQNKFHQQKISLAGYFDASYLLTERLKLRGGLRYTHDDAKLRDFRSQISGHDGNPIVNTVPGSTDFNATTARGAVNGNMSGRIGLDFQLSRDTLIYGGYSRGYRGAAFNAQAFFDPSELTIAKPETVDSYEIGTKTDLFNRVLRLNFAGFWYSYRNQQVLDIIPSNLTTPLINLPRARIRGIEIESRLRATRQLTLSASAGILNSTILEGKSRGFDVKGNSLISAPKLTASGAVDWDIGVSASGALKVHADVAYTSKQYFDLLNTDSLGQKAYALLNATASYTIADSNITLTVWARNITNQIYFTNTADASGLGFIYRQVGTPRMYGLTARKTF